jgi:heptosyltransferase-2
MKVIVLALPGVGDTLNTTPIFEILKKVKGAETYALVMYKSCKEVLESNPYIDRIVFWEFFENGFFRSVKFLHQLRREKFDVSIIGYPANRMEYNIVNFIIGAKKRLAHTYDHYNPSNLSFLNTQTIHENGHIHNVEENIRLLQLLGISSASIPPTSISIDEEEQKFGDGFISTFKKPVIAIHAYSTELKNMNKKCWSPEKFAKIIDVLMHDYDVILIEGPHDRIQNEKILSFCGRTPAILRNTTVKQTVAVLKRCRLLISNDSGVAHLAGAVKTPVVVIFGPTDPKRVSPWRGRCGIVRKELECSPCFYYSPRPLRCKFGDFRCLKSLSVEDVLKAVDKLLKDTAPQT